MSKYLFGNPALEEADLEIPEIEGAEGVETIDAEDLPEYEAEAQADSLVVAQESAEIEGTLDIVDGITDVATVISEGEGELTPRETNLVRVAANMAVAGTETPATDVIPGLESFTTRAQLVKAIEDQKIGVMQRVLAGLKSLMERIKKAGRALLNVFRSEIGIVKGLLPKVKALGNETKEVKLSWRLAISPDGSKETDVATIFKNVTQQSKLNATAASIIANYIATAAKAASTVFSAKFSDAALESIVKQHYDFAKETVKAYDMKKKTGSDKTTLFSTDTFVPGRYMEISISDTDKQISIATDSASGLDFLRPSGSGLQVDRTDSAASVSASALAKAMEACLQSAVKVVADNERAFVAYLRAMDLGTSLTENGSPVNAIASILSKGVREANSFTSDVYATFGFSVSLSTGILKELRKLATRMVDAAPAAA